MDHRTVVSRALCLSALVVRGTIESAIQLSPSPEDAEAYAELVRRLSYWLNEQEFTSLFTAAELDALSLEAGTWSSKEHETHFAQVEGLGVLLWALSIQDRLAAVNESFPVPDVEALVGWPASAAFDPKTPKLGSFPHNGSKWLEDTAQLRPPAVVKSERVSADCWHWRTQVAALQIANTPPPGGQPYELMIAIAAEEAHAAAAIARPVKNDFSISGRPFSTLPESGQLKVARIINARRTALHWLGGYATEWDAFPAHTAPEPIAA